jgi:hypothetical protein
MKYLVLKSFNNVQAGINFMSSFTYPSAFLVKSVIYDKNGSLLSEQAEEQNLTRFIYRVVDPYIYCIINENEYVDKEYCYDGNFIFFTKN